MHVTQPGILRLRIGEVGSVQDVVIIVRQCLVAVGIGSIRQPCTPDGVVFTQHRGVPKVVRLAVTCQQVTPDDAVVQYATRHAVLSHLSVVHQRHLSVVQSEGTIDNLGVVALQRYAAIAVEQ